MSLPLEYETLKIIWWVCLILFLIAFALTDGFDLGIGISLPILGKTDNERRVILNVIAPTWEGNQVWFVAAGGALFAVWPIVYSTAFSALYWVLLLALWALFLRPVGFDYRSKIAHPTWRMFWDWSLFVGGLVPAFVFGAAFGNLLIGIPFYFDDQMRSFFVGSLVGLLNPFAIYVGLISIVLMVMHGASYLQLRTVAPIYQRARKLALLTAPVYILMFAFAGLWVAQGIDGYAILHIDDINSVLTPLTKTVMTFRGAWMDNYALYPWMLMAPICGFVGALVVVFAAWLRASWVCFLGSSLSIIGTITTAAVSMYPFILPSSLHTNHSLTLWDSVASYKSLAILLIFNLFVLPCIVFYTVWVYKKIWGKVEIKDILEESNSSY